MLESEAIALEEEHVFKYLNIRKQEIDHFLDRFEAVIASSTLVAGFTIAGINDFDGESLNRSSPFQRTFFFATALGTVMGSVLATTVSFAMIILGPSLMLRGPPGSVEKAYWLLRRESKRVDMAQLFSVICFALCFGVSYYIRYPKRNSAFDFFPVVFSSIACLSIFAVLLYIKKLRKEFHVGKVCVLSPEKELGIFDSSFPEKEFNGTDRLSSFSLEGHSRTRRNSKKWFKLL